MGKLRLSLGHLKVARPERVCRASSCVFPAGSQCEPLETMAGICARQNGSRCTKICSSKKRVFTNVSGQIWAQGGGTNGGTASPMITPDEPPCVAVGVVSVLSRFVEPWAKTGGTGVAPVALSCAGVITGSQDVALNERGSLASSELACARGSSVDKCQRGKCMYTIHVPAARQQPAPAQTPTGPAS